MPPPPPATSALVAALRQARLIGSGEPRIEPLAGGVSSDIIRVREGAHDVVVKRALARLRVKEEWLADVSRNAVEHAYLRKVGALAPGSVPRVLGAKLDEGWFAMEFLGPPFTNWKAHLLAGQADATPARQAGTVLGRIHRLTWQQPEVAQEFATWRNFHQLRAEPYLESTARQRPEFAPWLRGEVERLRTTGLALVHGDFSPKNLLVAPGRLVVVDAEVAWFGDPAFDTAFLLTHLCLKALYHAPATAPYLALAAEFWQAYRVELGPRATPELEARTVRLGLCLLLARVHGKSPAEYLTTARATGYVTEFVGRHLPHPPARIAELTAAWERGILAL